MTTLDDNNNGNGNHNIISKEDNDDNNNNLNEEYNLSSSSSKIQLGFSEPLITSKHYDDDHDDDDDDDDIQLGHQSYMWNEWDGGIIGGKPSWLNPLDIPKKVIQCKNCTTRGNCKRTSKSSDDEQKTDIIVQPMNFICQLYVPVDTNDGDGSENEDNNTFHRTLYVYACPICCSRLGSSRSCTSDDKEAATKVITEGCIRVLRCQLPRKNQFYPYKISDDGEGDDEEYYNKHLSDYYNINLCQVCGQRATGKCPIQKKYFCCKNHQKEYKKYACASSSNNNNNNNNNNSYLQLPSVYYQSELVVEEEPNEGLSSAQEKYLYDNVKKNELFKNNRQKGTSGDHDDNDSDDIDDENLNQNDLNEATGISPDGGTKDPKTINFFIRCNRPNNAQEQVLRYNCNWNNNSEEEGKEDCSHLIDECDDDDDDNNHNDNNPLWIQSNYIPTNIPNCQYCNSKRKFEFQIMPQMLHYLLKNKGNDNSGGGDDDDDDGRKDNDNSSSNKNNRIVSEETKKILEASTTIIEKMKLEKTTTTKEGSEEKEKSQQQIQFQEQHDKLLKNVQDQILSGGGKNKISSTNNDNNNTGELDWGVIVVYTCTNSCCSSKKENDDDNNDDDDELGAYKEEYAWRQPPLC